MRVSFIALSLTDSTTPGFNEHEDPLGICYVAAAAANAGHSVHIVQQTVESDDRILDAALQNSPQVLGFTAVTAIWRRATALAARAKALQPAIVTVIGGSHACAAPEQSAIHFDFVVVGEGEATFVALIEAIQEGRIPREPGLCYRNGGSTVNTGYPARIRRLDGLMPYRTGLDHSKYDPAGSPPVPHGTTGFAAMVTSRGCSHSCGFCSNASIWHDPSCGRPVVAYRSPENVLDEVKYLRDELDVNYLAIEDTDFLARPREEQYRLLDLMAAEAKGVKWACMARPDRILPPVRSSSLERAEAALYAQRLAEGGCHLVCLGIESGNGAFRESMGRRFSDESMLEVFEILADAGLATTAFLVLGLPNETYETLDETNDFVMRLRAVRIRASFFYPFGNIPCAARSPIQWYSPEYAAPEFATTEVPTVKCEVSRHDLVQFRESMLKTFYARTQYSDLVRGLASRSAFWQATLSPWVAHLKQQGFWRSVPQSRTVSPTPTQSGNRHETATTREATWSSYSLPSTAS
jgi:radical SAM superfamily enzyme YgiQ (UPF0313 family)